MTSAPFLRLRPATQIPTRADRVSTRPPIGFAPEGEAGGLPFNSGQLIRVPQVTSRETGDNNPSVT